jgi:hypothetical protein
MTKPAENFKNEVIFSITIDLFTDQLVWKNVTYPHLKCHQD